MRKKKYENGGKTFSIFVAVTFVGIIGVFSYIRLPEKNATTRLALAQTKTETSETIYPSQYSDKHITENAIVSDERFADSVAWSGEDDRTNFLANVIGSLPTQTYPKSDTPEKGTWLWTPIPDITPAYRDEIIAGAQKNGVRNIYLSIDSYLDVFVMEDGEEKTKRKKEFDDIVADFIQVAQKNGMTVDAEGGWRNWAESGNMYKAFAVLDYAIDFNKTHDTKFRGFQYDVEPYSLSYYTRYKAPVLKNFVTLIHETVKKMQTLKANDLALSVVIPDFYDGESGETPAFYYAGEDGYTLDHLLRVLEQRPGSTLVIMSYRNFSTGEDGTIDISVDEINKANNSGTKVVIAQETGDVKPPYITFHNTSKSYLNKQMSIIQNTFKHDKSFGGVATHYVNALMELK